MEGKNVSPAVAVIVILIVIVIVLAVGWSIFLKKPKTADVDEEMSGGMMPDAGMMPADEAVPEAAPEDDTTEDVEDTGTEDVEEPEEESTPVEPEEDSG